MSSLGAAKKAEVDLSWDDEGDLLIEPGVLESQPGRLGDSQVP